MIGQTVSHYKILEKLGQGGMGVVYKARDLKLERPVALKFLARQGADDRATRLLVEEARAAAALDHPNICTVYEIGEADGRIFIAMAFLEGTGLDDLVAGGALPVDEAVRIATQIARSLRAAHECGIVHRDVKPGNVIVDARGRARLMDFGMAARTAPSGAAKSDPGKGTPAYMSPEQLLRRPIDGRADLWSWGVIAYEMLTGRLPFSIESPATLVRGILHEDPVAPCELRPEIPPALGNIVMRALSKEREQRHASAEELLHVLEVFRRAHVSASAPGAPHGVAVLPFRDLSREHDQAHLCEGIADHVMRDLAQVEGLEVAPRASTFALSELGERDGGIREIGRRLRVTSVLEGSVRKSNDRLRINAELRNAADGFTMWSDTYDRAMQDVFDVQEEIARQIARALELETAAPSPATRDVQAYDYYLRGRQFFYRSNRRGIECAIEMFTNATTRDRNYALAWAGVADCQSYLFMYHGGDAANLAEAEAASAEALRLDPDLAEARAARGFALSLSGHYTEAERQFETAVRLEPKLYEAWYFRGRTAYAQGRLERAARWFEQAGLVNPDDYQATSLLGFCLRSLGLPRRAEIAYRRAFERVERHLRLNPDDARALYLGGDCLIKTGLVERGMALVEKALRLEPHDSYILYGGACSFALIGRRDDALSLLERAVGGGFAHREWLDQDTDLDPLRGDPRFESLVASLCRAGCKDVAAG